MAEDDFKFDVAFSFVANDEGLATEINDRLQDRLSTFLYSKQQEGLAGTDGEQTFSEVFGKQARIVVVLYRKKWGHTRWTRIEETAIRGRAFDEGYDFTLFIPLMTRTSCQSGSRRPEFGLIWLAGGHQVQRLSLSRKRAKRAARHILKLS